MDVETENDTSFFSNNLLSPEDLDVSVDFSDLLGCNGHIDADEIVQSLEDFPVELGTLGDLHEDLLHEYSDSSSDSGISGGLGHYDSLLSSDLQYAIKEEPLSPSSSCSSDSVFLQGRTEIEIKSEPVSPVNASSSPPVVQNVSPVHTDPLTPILIGSNISSNDTSFKFNHIINNKVKIQPKPANNTGHQKQAIQAKDQSKPLVLTPEEFKKLTSQGVLKFQPPSQNNVKVEMPVNHASNHSNVQQLPVPSNPILHADTEVKNFKRQQRMIKNRESASLSRKRKKEYLSTLEEQLKEFTFQNQQLQKENEDLKRRLSAIENENEILKKSLPMSPAKKICLMALIVFFSLNLGTFSDFLLTQRKYLVPTDPSLIHRGRTLMSVQSDEGAAISSFLPQEQYKQLRKILSEYPQELNDVSNKTLYELYTCPTYFNKTESVRLANQLSGWMLRHEELKQKKGQKSVKKKGSSRTKAALTGRTEYSNKNKESKYELTLTNMDNMRHFWQSFPRRNDTFYVFSFSSDYYLLPAVAHNKTMRPRMSLMMPATSLNETMQPPSGSIGMMQIDCEVLDTQLVHVHKLSVAQQRGFNSSHYHDKSHFFP